VDTDGDPPRYIPQDVGELRDFLTSFMSAAPTFVDPDFTWMTIDTQFLTLHDGLQVVRARIGEASYAKAIEISGRMRALFEADPEDKTGQAHEGCLLIWEIDKLLKPHG